MPTNLTPIANGQRTDATHVNQLLSPINRLESGAAYWAGETAGSSTAYTAGLTPAAGNNTEGTIVNVLLHATCGDEPTLSLNSHDDLPIKSGGEALSTGDLLVGSVATLICAGGAWHVIGVSGGGSGLQAQIDALAATVAALNPGGGEVVEGTPDYGNDGGTGDRRSLITVATTITVNYGGGENAQSFVDGNVANSMWFNTSQGATGKELSFDFDIPVLITEARFYNGGGYSGPYGTWQWQATNDDDATFKLFPAFAWNPAAGGGWTVLPGLETNSAGYSKYKLVGLSGSLNSANSLGDFEFKIVGL